MATAKSKRPTGAPKGNRNAVGNRGGPGAPPIYNKTFPERAFRLALLGATDAEQAAAFGVGESTINSWKREHLEFAAALTRGKVEADAHIASALYHRAKGYSHKALKIFQYEGAPVKVEYTEHYPPDTAAAKHWLNNRRPQNWRDKIDVEGEVTVPVSFIIQRTKAQKVAG